MSAVVNLSGCSAAFISSQGLIATNHHCAHRAIAAQSTVEHDYLADGFYATTPEQELEGKGLTVKLLESTTDVTDRLTSVIEAYDDPAERAKAVRRKINELVTGCEEPDTAVECRVASFYQGSQFKLFRELTLRDVRIVYAPPSSIGNYGGEIDNWMWPRHAGDFTLLRAYVGPDGKPASFSEGNVPHQPERWLSPGATGVGPGDFVAVLGFPGHTDRYLPVAEVERQIEQELPRRVDLYGEWIDLYEDVGRKDPAVQIKIASRLRSLANRHKNARGMLVGIERMKLLERRRAEEDRMHRWAEQQGAPYDAVLPALETLAEDRRTSFEREFLLDDASRAATTLSTALMLARWAKERRLDDLDRAPGYADRDRKRIWSRIERNLRDFDPNVDQATLAVLLRRLQALPEELRSDLGAIPGPEQASALVSRTRVHEDGFASEALETADWDSIAASSDPMIRLAVALLGPIEANEAAQEKRKGEMLQLGPRYFEMLREIRRGPVYPDANGTLRFSYATVTGYEPRDGLWAVPQTTLSGQLAKDTGREPFDLPEAVTRAAPRASGTFWADPELGDIPVCFLSTADTTGGNSGSAVIDGRGRWVGLNFDRVWENIAGDFGYNPALSRNIAVDVRYLLWMLDEVVGADRILEELDVARYADAAPRTKSGGPDLSPSSSADRGSFGVPAREGHASFSSASGCACSSGSDAPSGFAVAGWILLGLGLAHRRPRRRSS